MKMIKWIAAISSLALITGCASRASGIAPVAVSASDYAGLSCEDTIARYEAAYAKQTALTGKQNTAATVDAIGVFLVLVPASSLFGGDVSGELALAKGEVAALARARETNCAPK